jgi:hypothetical protein
VERSGHEFLTKKKNIYIYIKNDYFNKIDINLDHLMEDSFKSCYVN